MEKTGERYGAARRALLGGIADGASAALSMAVPARRVRVSEPEVDVAELRASIVDWADWLLAIDAAADA